MLLTQASECLRKFRGKLRIFSNEFFRGLWLSSGITFELCRESMGERV